MMGGGGGEKKVIFSFLYILGVPENMIHFGILIVLIQSKYCADCFYGLMYYT